MSKSAIKDISRNKKAKNTLQFEAAENKYINWSLITIFFVFITLLTTFKISGDDDFFWHLATGRYIVNTHSVPSADVFGFKTSGQQWMPFEWGWDVLTYGLYNMGGINIILAFRTLVFLLLFFLLFHLHEKFKVKLTVSLIMLTLLSFGIIDRLTPRPHIISLLFFVIVLYVIIDFRYFKRDNIKRIYYLPVLFLIWANMHMGILGGLFLLGIYFVSELLQYLYPAKFNSTEVKALSKDKMITLTILCILSVLVMFVNPNFYQTYIYAYSHTKMKLLDTINEWRSPFDSFASSGFVGTIYKAFLFAGLVVLAYAYKKKDLFFALVFIGFVIYSVRAVRFTVDYLIVITFFLTVAVNYYFVNFKSYGLKSFLFNSPVLKGIIALFLLFFIINFPGKLYMDYLKYYRVFGYGIDSDFIPVQMFDFIKENKITEIGERPLNHFGTGGFLIWNFPNAKNYIDSRNLNDNIFDEYSQLMAKKPGFEKKLNEDKIDYVIYLAPDLVRQPQEMETTIISFLSKKSDEWKLVFWDDKSFLFVKNIPKFKDIIDKYAYNYITPYNFGYQKDILEKGFSENKEKLKAELDRKISEEPNGVIDNSIKKTYAKKLMDL
ncbi:hypothetical protein BH10BAC5_BH10BAC5_00930 [soil metagenome]